MKTIDSTCAICGGPLSLRRPVDIDDETMRLLSEKVVPIMAHNQCADKRAYARSNAERLEAEKRRMEVWAGICPPVYRETDCEQLEKLCGPALVKVMAWEFGERGMVLKGRIRRGKTRAAYLLLWREFQNGRSVRALTSTQFHYEALRFSRDHSSMASWAKIICQPDILFIDDLGKAKFTEFSETMLFEAVETRMSFLKPVIVTTNQTGDSIQSRMTKERGAAIIERLREVCDTVNF